MDKKNIKLYYTLLLTLFCSLQSIGLLGYPDSTNTRYIVGVNQSDITPRPGFAMGGFGFAGRVSRGYWTRLYVSSYYIEDESGNYVIMCSADLWSIADGLKMDVLQYVQRREPNLSNCHEGQLLLSATHTHHSQANYSSAKGYNLFGAIHMGYSAKMRQFLIITIGESVIEAYKNRQAAHIYYSKNKMYGLQRNRSIESFVENPADLQLQVLDQYNGQLPEIDSLPLFVQDIRALQAVPNNSYTLHIKDMDKRTLGLMHFCSVHPTVMGPNMELYSSDIFGVARSVMLEDKYASYEEQPVISFFNGAEGDISPNWKKQDIQNTILLGRKLANYMVQGLEGEIVLHSQVHWKYDYIKISNREIENQYLPVDYKNKNAKTLKKSKPSAATLGGTTDGRTLLYNYGFRETIVSEEDDKREDIVNRLLDLLLSRNRLIKGRWITRLLIEQKEPAAIPLSIFGVGNVLLVGLPGEFTVGMSVRIKNRLHEQITAEDKTNRNDIIIIGLANEYLSYFTTAHEYELQRYEAGSMVYGQYSGHFVEQAISNLYNKSNRELSARHGKYKSSPKLNDNFNDFCSNDGWNEYEGLQNILPVPQARNYMSCTWETDKYYLLEFRFPEVSVHYKSLENSSFIEVDSDKNSLHFISYIYGCSEDAYLWKTIWMKDSNDRLKGEYKMIIEGHSSQPIEVGIE